MAQEVKIMGATYSDVPAVMLPDSNNVMHRFSDATPTTAIESDVAQGKVFLKSDGTLGTGTSSGGGGGGDSMSDAVRFFDYDGTLLHSYTAEEASALTELPENPSHSGLIAQGWNYTLEQMQTEVTKKGKCDIGQLYVTDDDKTRLYCTFQKGRLHPYLSVRPNGTVTVDWGDGSPTETLTGTSLTTVKTLDHEYATEGDYIITLAMESGTFAFSGASTTAYVLRKNTSEASYVHAPYAGAIRKVELGSSATISNYGFDYCANLETITLHDAINVIGINAFHYCYNLSNVVIPSGVTSINNYAFYGCASLASVDIPSSVMSIGSYAFNGCASLASVDIPSSVTSIGNYAFYGCTSLASVGIPSGVTSIEGSAFNNCASLASVDIPSSVTSIGSSAFSGCASLASVDIPSSVTSIGSSAFSGCASLASVDIPSGVTSIGNNAFYNCYSLINIEIPHTYPGTSLNQQFRNCRSLASITIPAKIKSIAASTFTGCYGMAEYHFLSATPPTLANTNAFSNIQPECVIYVPQGCLEAYQTATNWSTYASYMQEESAA